MEIDKKTKGRLMLMAGVGTLLICGVIITPTALLVPESLAFLGIPAALLAVGLSLLSGVYSCKKILKLVTWKESWQAFQKY